VSNGISITRSALRRENAVQKPELHVVATATECARAVEIAALAKPDVAVVDVDLATEQDGGLVPSLINGGNTRVLVLSGSRDGRHELAILRNTVFARYGWDGYRKPWLRDYFHAQPWFKPNPKFTYKQLADVDRKNAHFIAVREQGLTSDELSRMSPGDRTRLMSGKDYILPLLLGILRNEASFRDAMGPLRVRLSQYCSLDADPGLAKALRRAIR